LWNFCIGYVESVWRAWRVGIRRILGLPLTLLIVSYHR